MKDDNKILFGNDLSTEENKISDEKDNEIQYTVQNHKPSNKRSKKKANTTNNVNNISRMENKKPINDTK